MKTLFIFATLLTLGSVRAESDESQDNGSSSDIHISPNQTLAPRQLPDGSFTYPEIQNNVPIEFCSPATSDLIQNLRININPFPIEISTGNKLTFDISVDLMQKVSPNAKVSVRLQKKMLFFWLPILCMNIGKALSAGSCTYTVDELLKAARVCPDYCPPGQYNALPFLSGHYQGPTKEATVNIPGILSWFTSGTVWAEAKVIDQNGKEIACLQTTLTLV